MKNLLLILVTLFSVSVMASGGADDVDSTNFGQKDESTGIEHCNDGRGTTDLDTGTPASNNDEGDRGKSVEGNG